MFTRSKNVVSVAVFLVSATTASLSAHATLTLTAAGIADGFILSTVVTNGFSATYGAIG